ncbi:hypothetical protein IWX92DRAFT_377934 [Phyllosticta citricarpa]
MTGRERRIRGETEALCVLCRLDGWMDRFPWFGLFRFISGGVGLMGWGVFLSLRLFGALCCVVLCCVALGAAGVEILCVWFLSEEEEEEEEVVGVVKGECALHQVYERNQVCAQ